MNEHRTAVLTHYYALESASAGRGCHGLKMVFCGPFLTGYYRIVPAKTGLQGGFETPPRPPALPSGAWAIFKMYTHRCERLSPITVRIGRTDLNAHGEPERRRGFQNTTMTAAAMRFG